MKKYFLIGTIALLLLSLITLALADNGGGIVLLDTNITSIDGWPDNQAMPSFSYASDGNLTIDFNVATDTNYGTTWADLNYSLTNTQGSGTEIVKGLVVDGNKCQTNFIGDWNNQANSDVNLVGYWKFDSGASAWDFSGKGNTGTYYTNGVSSTAQGKWDTNAAYFLNSNDYVSIADSASLTFNNATGDLPFSISMWVNPTASGVEQSLVGKYTAVNTDGEWSSHILDNGTYYFQCLDSAIFNLRIKIISSFTANYNVWSHVVFTYDGSGSHTGLNIYVNGVQDPSPTRANENGYVKMDAYSAPVDIGVVNRNNPPWDIWFNGWIEEVKIYDKALTANDVSRDYALSARNFRTCSYDWNISGIADANYYANVLARDNVGNSDFNASNNNFRVNPSGAPPADSCSCPASGNWEITNGDVCTLSTLCEITGNFNCENGSLAITSTGTLVYPSNKKFHWNLNNCHIHYDLTGGKIKTKW